MTRACGLSRRAAGLALALAVVAVGPCAQAAKPAAEKSAKATEVPKESKAPTASTASKASSGKVHTLALISLDNDERYGNRRLERAYLGHPAGRLLPAAELGVADTELALADDGLRLQVRDVRLPSADELPAALRKLRDEGVRHWLLDLPADMVPAAVAAGGDAVLLFNVSAAQDVLRGSRCALPLLHTYPSQAMLSDALAQYLAARSWRQVLALQGAAPNDAALGDAWARAGKRFGLSTTVKPFKLSGDPRERDLANPRLLTADRGHDVVLVHDSEGEFARTLPYATQWPRPVAGSNGLMALAWHPQWDRHGGPQVSRRFVRLAKRPMVGQDWAAWMAVRTVAAVLQAKPGALPPEQARLLRSGQVSVDGSKGPALTYRAWDGQLRQPVFLAHADGVVATAPMDGVLHPTEVLDTLGHDMAESACKVRP